MSGMINGTQELKGNISEKESLRGGIPITIGVSPTIEVVEGVGLHYVYITDINGRKAFTVYDGRDYVLTEADKQDIANLFEYTKSNAIITDAKGETISLTDSATAPLQGMKVFGKSWQDGTPTSDAPQDIHSHGESGSIFYTFTFDGFRPQDMIVSTPYGLHGVPVSSGGNYTDANGKQWICDEIDLERGVYVQRIWKGKPTKALVFTSIDSNGRAQGNNFNAFNVKSTSSTLQAYCNKLKWSSWAGTDKTFAVYGAMGFYYKDNSKTLDEINTMFAEFGTDIEFAFILETPIETYLPTSLVAQYKELYTNYPSTIITNDTDAYTEVKYVADTKLYIDKKFNELAVALVSQ